MKEKNVNKGEEKMKEKTNKTTIAIVVLAILLVAAVVYIGIGMYNESKTKKETEIFRSGAQANAQQTLFELYNIGKQCQPWEVPVTDENKTKITMYPLECVYQQAITCQALPITVGEQTVNMIAVECLQQQEQQ